MFRKENLCIALLVLTAVIIKYWIADYGLPFMFHPDEAYIIKDPFKLLFNYSHLDFTSGTNLYFWIISAWYGLYFILGEVTGTLHGFGSFRDLLVGEAPAVIFWGRMLAILLSITGSIFLFLIVRKFTSHKMLRLLFGLTLILNPIEIISSLWVKFDPAAYCFLSVLLYFSYACFIENRKELRKKIYLLCFIGVSLRIDLIVFLFCFSLADLFDSREKIPDFVRRRILIWIKGSIIYLLITLLPFVLFYKWKGYSSDETLIVTRTFEQAIAGGSRSAGPGTLPATIASNIKFYLFNSALVTLGPLAVCFAVVTAIRYRKEKFIFLLSVTLLCFLLPLLLFSFHAPHYFLLASTILLLLNFYGLSAFERKKNALFLSVFNLVYIGSITVQIILAIKFQTDTRIESREFILGRTKPGELIAIEEYLNPGLFPPIDECPDVLREKAKFLQENHLGSGKTFEMKAGHGDGQDCRGILEISEPKRYIGTAAEGRWQIDHDPRLMKSKGPVYFATQQNYHLQSNDSFSEFINKDYILAKVFEQKFTDPRISLVIQGEVFFPKLNLYERKTGSVNGE